MNTDSIEALNSKEKKEQKSNVNSHANIEPAKKDARNRAKETEQTKNKDTQKMILTHKIVTSNMIQKQSKKKKTHRK